MTLGRDPRDRPVPVSVGQRRGHSAAVVLAVLALVFVAGAFGRLVEPPAGRVPVGVLEGSPGPSVEPGFALVSPNSDVLYLRTTEIVVRGVAPSRIHQLEATIFVRGRPIGDSVIDVGDDGRFDGIVSFAPSAARTAAHFELRELGGVGDPLAELTFPVEAGALVLPRDPSRLRGEAGGTLVIDVLVYGQVRQIRGLLTGEDGTLIAVGSRRLGAGLAVAEEPRTLTLPLVIPDQRLPDRARLHLLAFDRDGMEVEHIDSNVVLVNR